LFHLSAPLIGHVKTEWRGAGVVICLERGADLHMVQLMPLPPTGYCFSKIQIAFYTFLVPAHHTHTPVKRVCVYDVNLRWPAPPVIFLNVALILINIFSFILNGLRQYAISKSAGPCSLLAVSVNVT